MRMFGGFGKRFLKDYHETCPKSEPTEEYDDRVGLYELWVHFNPLPSSVRLIVSRYHHLNHFSLFGGGYKGGAVSIMKSLLAKYGDKTEV